MGYIRRPLRWLLVELWRYAVPLVLTLGAFSSFRSQDNVAGITSLIFATSYVLLLVALRMDDLRPNRKLAIFAFTFAGFGLLIILVKAVATRLQR